MRLIHVETSWVNDNMIISSMKYCMEYQGRMVVLG